MEKFHEWFAFGSEDEDANKPPEGDGNDGDDDADDDDSDDGQEPDKEKAKLRAEAARHRKARNDERAKRVAAEKALKEKTDAEKDELTRAKDRVTELEAEVNKLTTEKQELVLQNVVQRESTKLGFADPEDAVKLLDRAALETDDDGRPTNTEDVLKALLETRPYLAGTTEDGRVATSETSKGRPNGSHRSKKLTPADLEKMTPEQVAQLSDNDFISIMTPSA